MGSGVRILRRASPYKDDMFFCGAVEEWGLRAEVVFGPYGVGSSTVVVVGADDHIRPCRTGLFGR